MTTTIYESMSKLRAEFGRATAALLDAQKFANECPGGHARAIVKMALEDYIAAYENLNRNAWRDAGPVAPVADETDIAEYQTVDGVMSYAANDDGEEIPY